MIGNRGLFGRLRGHERRPECLFGSVDETDFELASQQSAEATKNVRASNMEAQPDQNVNPA